MMLIQMILRPVGILCVHCKCLNDACVYRKSVLLMQRYQCWGSSVALAVRWHDLTIWDMKCFMNF